MAIVSKAAAWRALAVALVLAALGANCGSAVAAAGPWWRSDQAQLRLIAASDATGSAQSLSLGLEFKLIPGWKIYWRSPGDAGYPPRVNWAGSENLESAAIRWPLPHRFTVLGLETLGYEDSVVLPLDAVPFERGKALKLRATVSFLTCEEICVPYEAHLSLDLPAGPQTTTREAALIARFAAEVPPQAGGDSLRLDRALVDGPPGDQSVRVVVPAARALSAPDLFIEGPPGFRFSRPRLSAGDAGSQVLTALASPPPGTLGSGADLTGKTLTFTLVSGGRAVEQRLVASRGNAFAEHAPAPFSWRTLAGMFALALVGGLILNLMPCVLPVLSIKLLSAVGHAGAPERTVRQGFIASAAGIVASFLVLATAAVVLKSAGMAAGWGIQFQQPLFLIAMALLLMLFASNLWGLFEFHLPGAISDVAANTGQGHGMLGHFLTGAFVTLLATPCSAPFLGTAVGFALARGPGEIYLIFAALGVGLALPYLLVAAVPHLATRLPRPGPWMGTVRRVLGLALAATAIWLILVLDAQVGRGAAVIAAIALTLVPVVLLGRTLVPSLPRAVGWAGVGIMAAAALVAPLVVPRGQSRTTTAGTAGEAVRWVAFNPAAIAGEITVGRVVFVDVTADWCLTCQVNKALVLDPEPIRSRLNGPRVVAMRADWTRPDPAIAAFLHRYGRFGIPFNVVYGPGTPGGRVLPELLTREAVAAALEAASGNPRTAGR